MSATEDPGSTRDPRSAAPAYAQATWTSFDRFGRYAAIARATRASLGPGAWRVLDVGDSAGHLHLFDPGLQVVGLDVELADKPLPDTCRVRADGARLPVADATFDAVVSSDVLEHVAPERRLGFLAELSRASRDLVVVAAPFDTPGVAGCEDLVRRYALFSAAAPQPQLEEHRANGLPSLAATVEVLAGGGAQVATVGNGNLWDWLLMMVLRFQIEARPDLRPLGEGYDTWYNQALASRAEVGPYYRHVVVARTGGPPETGQPVVSQSVAGGLTEVGSVGPAGTDPAASLGTGDLAAVLAALVAADSTEVVRHDARQIEHGLHGRLDELHGRVDQLNVRLDHLGERLEALIELEVSMAEQIRGLLRPLTKAVRPFKRGSSG